MAFNQNSVFGLSFSNSYLDGVPFKISAAFRPRTQPVLSQDLLAPVRPCAALQEEYTFDTEEAVLAWSAARAEAKAEAERQAAERARAAVAAAQSSSSDSEDDEDASEPSAKSEAKTSESAAVKPPRQLPVGASLSSGILMPTPIQSSQKKVQSPMAPKANVDLALFEKEDDPFNNMELQTLNDMEELRTLLGGGSSSQGPSPNPDQQTAEAVSQREGLCAVNGTSGQESVPACTTAPVDSNNIFNSIPGVKMYESRPAGNSSAGASCATNRTNPFSTSSGAANEGGSSDEDYVKIRPDYSQQSVQFQRDLGLANSQPTSHRVSGVEVPQPYANSKLALGGELPQAYANSKLFKPALPPIRPRGKSLGGEIAMDNAAVVCSESTSPVPQIHGGRVGTGMSQSAYVMSMSSSTPPAAVDMSASDILPTDRHCAYTGFSGAQSNAPSTSHASGNNHFSRYGNLGSGSPTPMNGGGGGGNADRGRLRNAKSNPDFLAGSDSPPYGDRPNSSLYQPWNPYQPLPPTPVPELRSASSSPERLPSESCHRSSPQPPPPPPPSNHTTTVANPIPHVQPEYDPYPSLSSEAKTFVNNLTSMGFSRSRVSRAVEKFGTDEREVVDHLFSVDKLVERRFTPDLAETSLQLFHNNVSKAEIFLRLYQQFTELGFAGESIQRALVKHELDHDKALDYLTT